MRSELTRQQRSADETRSNIISAARDLFAKRGCAATRVEDIARLAGVATVTVYKSVGGKSGILRLLVDLWTTSPIRNAAAESIASSQDAVQIMAIVADTMRRMREEFADIIYALHDAATADRDVAKNLAVATSRYRGSCLMVATKLAELGALRSGVSIEHARDLLWFHFGYWSWYTLHDENGWTYKQSEKWLLASVTHAILSEAALNKSGHPAKSRRSVTSKKNALAAKR